MLLPAIWEMTLLKNLSNRRRVFTVDWFLDPVCWAVAGALVLKQQRARNLGRVFGGTIHLDACQSITCIVFEDLNC